MNHHNHFNHISNHQRGIRGYGIKLGCMKKHVTNNNINYCSTFNSLIHINISKWFILCFDTTEAVTKN